MLEPTQSRARIGVVGCGYIAREIYFPILRTLSGLVEVTAVCDVNLTAAQEATRLFPTARPDTSVAAMLASNDLDAIMVLTSERFNAPVARAALDAGVSVYLEKPPATSVGEWKSLKAAEDASRARVFTAFNRRHTPFFDRWRAPGNLRMVTGTLSRRDRDFATFPYTAVHLIDAAQFYSGQSFSSVRVDSSSVEGQTAWRLEGTLSAGTRCRLTFIPDGNAEAEFLTLESAGSALTMHFPFATTGAERLETFGFAPCFRDFLQFLNQSDESPHRLENSFATVAVLERMLASSSKQTSEATETSIDSLPRN